MAAPAQQPRDTAQSESHIHRWVIVGVLVVLTVIGLITYNFHESNEEAEQKADQLVTALQDAGLPTPANTDTVVRVLGSDGGVVCEDPTGAMRKALFDAALVNGASFVGQRPIRAAPRSLIEAQLLVTEIYCPDEIDEFRERLNDYRADDVK